MARGKTLFDVVFRMTNYGVESHVTRKCWLKHPGTFLRVTEVEPNPRVSSCAIRMRSPLLPAARTPKPARPMSQAGRCMGSRGMGEATAGERHHEAHLPQHAQRALRLAPLHGRGPGHHPSASVCCKRAQVCSPLPWLATGLAGWHAGRDQRRDALQR